MQRKFAFYAFFVLLLALLSSYFLLDFFAFDPKKNITFRYLEDLGEQHISIDDYRQVIGNHQACFEHVRRKNLTSYYERKFSSTSSISREIIDQEVEKDLRDGRLSMFKRFRSTKNITTMYHRNKLVGLYNCLPENEVTNDSVMIYNVCLNKDFRGKGLGKVLMKNAISHCQAKEVGRKLSLLVYDDDHLAINLYKKLGFDFEEPDEDFPDEFYYFNKSLMVYSGKTQD
ncbi:MAG: hypothetical protein CMP11_01565 [Zetaproteobacteria bacterium]|nr:hypothetical protein [Pseudobdellovibrionaceae bacterium]|tara:strand:- start:31 stop:717 length:687 start_codon:yes stop_codon:yes gene_type:complete